MRWSWRAVGAGMVCAWMMAACGGGGTADPAPVVAEPAPAPAPVAAAAPCSGADGSGWCWLQPSTPPRQWMDFHFVDSQHGWAAGESGALIATSDGGRTWQWQATPVREELSLVRFADANRGWAYASGSRRVLETTDGGQHWAVVGEVPLGAPYRFFEKAVRNFWVTPEGVLVASSDERGTAVSEDGGRNWRVLEMPPVQAVGNSGTLWSGFLQNLWVSRDRGRTASVSLALPSGAYFSGVDLASDGRLSVIATKYDPGASTAVRYTSTDGGRTWGSAPYPLPESRPGIDFDVIGAGALSALWAFQGGAGWGQSREQEWRALVGLWHSADAGQTWRQGSLPLADIGTDAQPAYLDGRSLWLKAGGSSYVTVDGGRSWAQVAERPVKTWYPIVYFGPDGTLWLTTESSLERSRDGRSWESVNLPGGDVSLVQFVDARNGWAITQDCPEYNCASTLYRSTDGGTTWLAGARAQGHVVAFADGLIGILQRGDQSLQRTTDGGATWKDVGNDRRSTPYSQRIYFRNAREGWLLGARAVTKTTDGGLTWSAPVALPETGTSGFDIGFADANNGWIVGDRGLVLATRDGGATWERQESHTERLLNRIFPLGPDTAWIGGYGALLTTRTGGRAR